ncbi:MAG: alcohol dehydrogenase, partial [Deltaproteobacteria bacterium]|nr:alcohol dehydrogenase [Deltaproteobacteria bacterium]
GKDVKLDLTPLWLKLQTVKGCYAYGYNETPTGPKQAFQMALEMMGEGKIQVEDMLTHKFPLEDYRKMIKVNVNKTAGRAIKTAVSFEN